MKRLILRIMPIAAAGVFGFVVGLIYENGRTVPRETVQRAEAHKCVGGRLLMSDVIETKGWSVFNLGEDISQLEWTSSEEESPITLYCVRRTWKEKKPRVSGVTVEGNRVTWTDGLHDFDLTISPPREPDAEPSDGAESRQRPAE
jgi:hypothetical protein